MRHDESPRYAISEEMGRRLAAILHADVQGYSRLIAHDEVATLRILTPYLQMMKEVVHHHGGQAIGSRGDSLLAEFPSVRSAVQCAVEMQHELTERNAALPAEQRIEFRMGIHVGEVVEDGEQLHGDGINIAVRIEGLAEAGGICISDSVYHQVKNKLPLQYEDLGHQQLKNIAEPVRVYRVVLNEAAWAMVEAAQWNRPQTRRAGTTLRPRSVFVLVFVSVLLVAGIIAVRYFLFSTPSPQHPTLSTQAAPAALPLPDKPSIIVLPFTNMSNDPEQEYFSDGLTEDLTSDLSKLSGLFVISRNTAFTYKGKAIKLPEVSRELGVRYVLEGSVRKGGDQVRITAQLIDATQDQQMWSERYDRPLTELFALQDEIRQKIVTALKVKLTPEEQARFQRAPTTNLEAYDFFLRGMEARLRGFFETKQELNAQARQLFEKAIVLDSQYAAAYAGLGWTYWLDWFFQWNPDRTQSLERAFDLAQRAVALDDSLSVAHQLLGRVYVWQKQHEQALVEAQRVITLDPNNADGYWNLGNILTFAGQPEEGIEVIKQGMRLNPRYRSSDLLQLGFAYRVAGRYEEALVSLKKVLALNPNSGAAHRHLAICYAELGRQEEARAEMAEAQRLNPTYSLEWVRQNFPYKDPADLERELAALRKAGLK